jgi:hypothetical protein
VNVLWEEDGAYYAGRVIGYSMRTAKHKIEYDEGTVETITLHKTKTGASWKRLPDAAPRIAQQGSQSNPTAPSDGMHARSTPLLPPCSSFIDQTLQLIEEAISKDALYQDTPYQDARRESYDNGSEISTHFAGKDCTDEDDLYEEADDEDSFSNDGSIESDSVQMDDLESEDEASDEDEDEDEDDRSLVNDRTGAKRHGSLHDDRTLTFRELIVAALHSFGGRAARRDIGRCSNAIH